MDVPAATNPMELQQAGSFFSDVRVLILVKSMQEGSTDAGPAVLWLLCTRAVQIYDGHVVCSGLLRGRASQWL